MGKMKMCICTALVLISILTVSCSSLLQDTLATTQIINEIRNTLTSDSIDQNACSVSADNFYLGKNENNEVRSILIGDLTPGVTINALLFCDRDLDNPGSGRRDLAVFKVFNTYDIDSFIFSEWAVITDQISDAFFDGSIAFSQRIAKYVDEKNVKISILNSYANFSYTYDSENNRLLQLLQRCRRIPWFSDDLAWGNNDFRFGSEEEALETLKQYAGRLGINVSPQYKIEFVTPEVFEAMYRMTVAQGIEDVEEKIWEEKDSAYWIEAAQDWYGLPIFSGNFGCVYDGMNLSGDDYRYTLMNQISFIQSERGVQNFRVIFAFQIFEEGAEEKLVSLWDALQALKIHIENPLNETEALYGLPEKDVLIDRIELCYLPIIQKSQIENRSGDIPPEQSMDRNGGNDLPMFQMIPCWTFRVVWEEAGFCFSQDCAVNAITGEYLLQTMYAPDV